MANKEEVIEVEVHCESDFPKKNEESTKRPEDDSGLDYTSESEGFSDEGPFSSLGSIDKISTIVEDNDEDVPFNLDDPFIPEYIRLFFQGIEEPAIEVPMNCKPNWLDMEKFKRGQKFARDYLFCINYAEMLSLISIFAVKTALQPLIFTGKSDTPFKAFKRYLSTLTRLKSWYEEDPWNEQSKAYSNFRTVRAMHNNIHERLTSCPAGEFQLRVTVTSVPKWSTSREYLLNDFQSACPIPHPSIPKISEKLKGVTQSGMSATQFAFVGYAVTFPQHFGIHYASDEDLEAFVHMWRVFGYILGTKDEYNFCSGSLSDVRQYTRDFIQHVIKPSFRHVTSDWEHMSRCLTQGISYYIPGASFEVAIRDICELLNIHSPRLAKNLSYTHLFFYLSTRLTFEHLLKLPGMLRMQNALLDRAVKKAQNASPEILEKWEKSQFSYVKVAKETVDTHL